MVKDKSCPSLWCKNGTTESQSATFTIEAYHVKLNDFTSCSNIATGSLGIARFLPILNLLRTGPWPKKSHSAAVAMDNSSTWRFEDWEEKSSINGEISPLPCLIPGDFLDMSSPGQWSRRLEILAHSDPAFHGQLSICPFIDHFRLSDWVQAPLFVHVARGHSI